MIFDIFLLAMVLWAKCNYVHSQWCDSGQYSQPYALYGYTSNGPQAYESDVYFQSAYPWSYSQPVLYDYTPMYSPYQSNPQSIVVIVAEDGLDFVDLLTIPTVFDDRCDTSPICIPYPGSIPGCGCDCDFEKKSCGCKNRECSCKNIDCCSCECESCRGDCRCNKKKKCGKKSKCADHLGCCDYRQESDYCCDRGCKHRKTC